MSQQPEDSPSSHASVPGTGGASDLFEGAARPVERIDRVLALIRREWLEYPDQRFWQMTVNLATRMGITSYASVLEDEAFIEMLERRAGPASGRTE